MKKYINNLINQKNRMNKIKVIYHNLKENDNKLHNLFYIMLIFVIKGVLGFWG